MENDKELLNEREECLPPILISLESETSVSLHIEKLQKCLLYMPTYEISELDQKLLQFILPELLRALSKTQIDITLLDDMCDDDFMANTVNDNLRAMFDLLQLLKHILEFLIKNKEINLLNIRHVGVVAIQILISAFGHIKTSSQEFKRNCQSDLLKILEITQECHSLYIQLFESCVSVTELTDNNEDINLLINGNLSDLSNILYSITVKLMTTNWKGYLGILQKFIDVLKNRISLKKPIADLTVVIHEKLSSLCELEPVDLTSASHSIKLSGFLVKVVLKMIHICWDYKRASIEDIIQFTSLIYSFSPDTFMNECPSELITLLDDTIFSHIKPFLYRFIREDIFYQAVESKTLLCDKYAFGLLNLLCSCMQCLVTTDSVPHPRLDILTRLMFKSSKYCFDKLLVSDTIFENLVINISAAVIKYDETYITVESILLENILQEDIWNYFLATEVWRLLLRNSNPRFCLEVLTNLVQIDSRLEFGTNTDRFEAIYLKHFMRIVYRLLPDDLKYQMGRTFQTHPDTLRKMHVGDFPKQMKSIIEDLHQTTLIQLDNVAKDNFTSKDLKTLVDNLESLSTVNFQAMNMNPVNLANAIGSIWESTIADTDTDTDNNVFKYFIAKVFKITNNLAMQLNNKQLYAVLSQLIRLSSNASYNVQICLMLFSFAHLDANQLGPDGCLLKMISNILTNLLRNPNNIIKQLVLENLNVFTQYGKHVVVREVIMKCDNNMKTLISDYLQQHVVKSKFDNEYFKFVGNLEYKHNCVEWKQTFLENKCKKLKLDNLGNAVKPVDRHQQQNQISNEENTLKYKLKQFKYKPLPKKNRNEDEDGAKEEVVDSIDEVLTRIKGEVKCLMNVLKSEKLTAKNSSDLKIISNQLLSLM